STVIWSARVGGQGGRDDSSRTFRFGSGAFIERIRVQARSTKPDDDLALRSPFLVARVGRGAVTDHHPLRARERGVEPVAEQALDVRQPLLPEGAGGRGQRGEDPR